MFRPHEGCRNAHAVLVFDARSDWHTKENDRFETFLDKWLEEGYYAVQAAAVLVWKRRNKCFFIRLVRDEERVYQHGL